MAQQLHTVPFDTALSVYVGHDGTWHRWDTDQDEAAEIEDPVAAFQANEPLADDADSWLEHQINAPPVPAGWGFFSPALGAGMQLHVVVHDTQNRLGQVVITERDTGAPLGTLAANEAGSAVDGSISIDPALEQFAINVRAKDSGLTICQAGANDPAYDDVLVITRAYSWAPNRGPDHACMVVGFGPPYGDPKIVGGKVAQAVGPMYCGCDGGVGFMNNNPWRGSVAPAFGLDTETLLDPCNEWDAGGLNPTSGAKVEAALQAARNAYDPGTLVHMNYRPPPYSQGVAHFPVQLRGGWDGVLYFPYRQTTETEGSWLVKLGTTFNEEFGEGIGTTDPPGAVAIAISRSWETKAGDLAKVVDKPIAVGNVKGLLASKADDSAAQPIAPITQPVTVELWADMLPPDGAEGYIGGGTGHATRGDAKTDPPPPPIGPGNMDLAFPGDGAQKGRCTVQLAKGWTWKIQGPGFMNYTGGGVDIPLDVPPANTLRINYTLNVLLALNVATVGPVPGQQGNVGVPALVELERVADGVWQAVAAGQTQTAPYIWTNGPREPGEYRVRAKRTGTAMPAPWGDWTGFTVTVGMSKDVQVMAPLPSGPPPGGGGG